MDANGYKAIGKTENGTNAESEIVRDRVEMVVYVRAVRWLNTLVRRGSKFVPVACCDGADDRTERQHRVGGVLERQRIQATSDTLVRTHPPAHLPVGLTFLGVGAARHDPAVERRKFSPRGFLERYSDRVRCLRLSGRELFHPGQMLDRYPDKSSARTDRESESARVEIAAPVSNH